MSADKWVSEREGHVIDKIEYQSRVESSRNFLLYLHSYHICSHVRMESEPRISRIRICIIDAWVWRQGP